MASHPRCYQHRHLPRFGKLGCNPTWCKCANHATSLWLNLYNLSNCISCPEHTYIRCLSTFLGSGWEYGFTLTPLPPQILPQICESWEKSNLIQVYKPCHYTLFEAVECFKLYPMSSSNIFEVYAHLLRFLMGIWLHTHTITTTDASQDFWELGEILPDTSVQTMPLCFGWVCRTFQTASHVQGIPIWGSWALSQVVDGHMASHSHHYHHRFFKRFVRFGWNVTLCKCANHATTRL